MSNRSDHDYLYTPDNQQALRDMVDLLEEKTNALQNLEMKRSLPSKRITLGPNEHSGLQQFSVDKGTQTIELQISETTGVLEDNETITGSLNYIPPGGSGYKPKGIRFGHAEFRVQPKKVLGFFDAVNVQLTFRNPSKKHRGVFEIRFR